MSAKLLVIDSDREVARAFARALARSDFTVLAAPTVNDGLALLREHQPQALILEIRVPGPPHVTELRLLKKLYPQLPVLVTTAFSTSFTESDAKREGAAGYFVKPFDIRTLLESLQTLMKNEQGGAAPSLMPDLTAWPRLAFLQLKLQGVFV